MCSTALPYLTMRQPFPCDCPLLLAVTASAADFSAACTCGTTGLTVPVPPAWVTCARGSPRYGRCGTMHVVPHAAIMLLRA